MAGQMARGVTVAALVALVAAGAGGCSGGGGEKVSGAASKAASQASALASQGAAALASATAEARRKLDSVKGGIDAKDDVKLGAVGTDSAGRSTVTVTAHNTADATKSFAVQVVFRDTGGNLLDTVVVTVRDVAAGASATGTARSTHTLSGGVKAEVGTALRY
ncbi:FxLYD domain-containing protein [Streptomyces sp. NPDC001606]